MAHRTLWQISLNLMLIISSCRSIMRSNPAMWRRCNQCDRTYFPTQRLVLFHTFKRASSAARLKGMIFHRPNFTYSLSPATDQTLSVFLFKNNAPIGWKVEVMEIDKPLPSRGPWAPSCGASSWSCAAAPTGCPSRPRTYVWTAWWPPVDCSYCPASCLRLWCRCGPTPETPSTCCRKTLPLSKTTFSFDFLSIDIILRECWHQML